MQGWRLVKDKHDYLYLTNPREQEICKKMDNSVRDGERRNIKHTVELAHGLKLVQEQEVDK